jgi:hypothetical protein
MKAIRTKTGILVIVSFAMIAFSLSFILSRLPGDSHWQRYRAEHPEKAIQANLRQVVLAATFYLRRHDVNEVTYEDLLHSGELIEQPIKPVQGEDYHTIRLSRTDTKVEVVTRDGKTITYEFGTLGAGQMNPGSFVPSTFYRDVNQDNGGT